MRSSTLPAAIITVAQQKGGSGKTTLVAQLSTALIAIGQRVAVIDIDPQGSLGAWLALRRRVPDATPHGPAGASVTGWRLGVELGKYRANHDVVLIDTTPQTETETRAAIRAADLVLVPCQPSLLDVWATDAILDLARREDRRFTLVLNRVPPRGRAVVQVRKAIATKGWPVTSACLGNRVAFAESLARGCGVVETDRSSRAAEESMALAEEVVTLLV